MTNKYDYNKNKSEFTQEMINDTLKYQKQYGFDMGQNNVAWNNEGDAFRHTYMQSILAQRLMPYLGKYISYRHEKQGNKGGKTRGKRTWTCGTMNKVSKYIMRFAENTLTLQNFPSSSAKIS